MTQITMLFPEEYADHKYSLIHFKFFLQYAMLAGIHVEYIPSNDSVFIGDDNELFFSCVINGHQAIFDYSDHATRNWCERFDQVPYFKFQTNNHTIKSAIPLGPPIVGVKNYKTQGATMRNYMEVRESYNYEPGKRVLCKQLPNGAAIQRRNHVHKLISSYFDSDINANVDQLDFWKMHETGSVAVCVPGATNNMIDRGQMELFGLGVCTISPRLETRLPGGVVAQPDMHYVRCRDDYGDLVECVYRLYADLSVAKQIGSNARTLFEECFSPKSYWKWILENLSKSYA